MIEEESRDSLVLSNDSGMHVNVERNKNLVNVFVNHISEQLELFLNTDEVLCY